MEGKPRGPGCVRRSSRTARCAAIAAGQFADEILPYAVSRSAPVRRHGAHHRAPGRARRGPASGRAAADKLGKLRPVFAARGSVTAGNSSQMSDGAAAVLLMGDRVKATT